MTRPPRRRGTAAVVAALVTALGMSVAACGGDTQSAPQSGPREAGSSTTGTADPTGSPDSAPPTGSVTPSVAAASGIELAEATSALNAPEGWTTADGLLDYASAASGPGHYDSLLLVDHRSIAGPDATYDSLADSWFDVAPKGAEAKRLPDVDLAGTPAYCIFFTVKGDPSLNYDIGTIRNGQSIDISFVLDKKTFKKDPQLVESVIASFRWLD
jgi:hypothetical protein